MAFVKEKISDEDRKKYGIENWKNEHEWLVDKERKIYLISTGLDKEAHRRFWFLYDGKISILTCKSQLDAKEETYEIYKNHGIEKSHLSKLQEICSVLSEAMQERYKMIGLDKKVFFETK